MKLQEMIKLVEDSNTDTKLREMVIGYIKAAHQSGFEEGVMASIKVNAQVYDMLRRTN